MSVTIDYPVYNIAVQLDNGMSFNSTFAAATGLPLELEDQVAIAAARAVQGFDWSQAPLTPAATAATVTLSRQDATSTSVPLA